MRLVLPIPDCRPTAERDVNAPFKRTARNTVALKKQQREEFEFVMLFVPLCIFVSYFLELEDSVLLCEPTHNGHRTIKRM